MAESEAMKAMIRGRIGLMSARADNKMVWFGNLSIRLKLREREDIPTMATDGTNLFFNPTFTLSLTSKEIRFVLAHEVMHCAQLHPFRLHGRNPKLWNIAIDYAVNGQLIRAKDHTIALENNCVAGKKILHDNKYADMTADQIYSLLKKEIEENGGQVPESGDGTGFDEVLPPPPDCGDGDKSGEGNNPGQSPSAPRMTEEDWKIAAQDAKRGNGLQAGNTPGDWLRCVDKEAEPVVPWRALMRQYIVHNKKADYTWSRPNRRFVHQGIYLPGVLKQNVGPIVAFIDMSGSITDEWLQQSFAELGSLCMQCRPEALHVIYFDTRVSHHDVYTDYSNLELKAHGGGGTAFQPMFDYVTDPENNVGKPICSLVFTDLYCGDSPSAPDYPVLWMVPKDNYKQDFDFGRVISV